MSIVDDVRALDEFPMRDCPDCDNTNNTFVNPRRCWNCGHEWDGEIA